MHNIMKKKQQIYVIDQQLFLINREYCNVISRLKMGGEPDFSNIVSISRMELDIFFFPYKV